MRQNRGNQRQPVTVERVVQREKSRSYQQQVGEHQRNLREKLRKQTRTSKIFSIFQRGAITRKLYNQPISPYGSNIPNIQQKKYTGRRGRPRGTVDPRYAPYGGVYGFRKAQALAIRQARLEAMRRATVTPQQELLLRQIEARRMAEMQNPERKTIPSTYGRVPISGIMEEIDSASKLFD